MRYIAVYFYCVFLVSAHLYRAYFNVPTDTDVLGDWKSVLEDLVTRA